MSSVPAVRISAEMMETVLVKGDLSALKPVERVSYYHAVCESIGLNPLTQPFAYITLNGKLTLYAKRDCADQLRKINNISITIPSREVVEGCYVVTARAQNPAQRQDESLGAVPIDGLKGEARSNAMMKAETKAKRRVTLSICGLAFMDESEVDSVQGAVHVTVGQDGELLSGTREAAQAVAQEKIAAMQAKAGITPAIKEPAPAPIIDATLDPDPPTLHDDIQAHPPKAASKKPYDKFAMYAALEGLKKRFVALGAEAEYRRILGLYGATKRTELPTNDGGTQARAAYKEMSLRVADLEIIPAVEKLPDAIEQVIGTVLRCGGVSYAVVDSDEGQCWHVMPGGAA